MQKVNELWRSLIQLMFHRFTAYPQSNKLRIKQLYTKMNLMDMYMYSSESYPNMMFSRSMMIDTEDC